MTSIFLTHIMMESNHLIQKRSASSGHRNRAARVAGDHSTTEPTKLLDKLLKIIIS